MQKSDSQARPVNLAIRVLDGEVKLHGSEPIILLKGEIIVPPGMDGKPVLVRFLARNAHPEAVERLLEVDRLVLFRNCVKYQALESGVDLWETYEYSWIDAESEIALQGCLCRVVIKTTGGRERPYGDLLMPDKAVRLRTAEDLVAFASRYMAQSIDGVENNSNCLLRLYSPKTKEVMPSWVYAARLEERRDTANGVKFFSVPAPFEQTWKEAFVDGKQSSGWPRIVAAALGVTVGKLSADHEGMVDLLRKDLEGEQIVVEAIPGQRVRSVTGSAIVRRDSTLALAAQACEENGEHRFVPMTVALQVGGARHESMLTAVLYQAVPDVDYERFSAKTIRTKNIP
ncbi:hypothetical protein [Paracidovorax wautersii]|uniref:Uncharacterized protein n=1 Tax=Paracidovorax wautersii TaxID=1177982 RepID=A0A1I2HU02_9BURK|nr:hypothetical protein [Paracidovorax wautersii]SFF33232.1 hypothetical protein SAMN04489711_1343 [Paracidovorax wautersii]